MRGTCCSLDIAFTPVRSSPARACACLNGFIGCRICHYETSMEVVVRFGSRVGGTLAVAQVIRDGIFSKVSILVTKLIGAERESFARALVTGC